MGIPVRHTISRFHRNAIANEHDPRGPLHSTNHRVQNFNIISNNKRQLFGDQLLVGGLKILHVLLSPECLQIVLYSPNSNSTPTSNGRQIGD